MAIQSLILPNEVELGLGTASNVGLIEDLGQVFQSSGLPNVDAQQNIASRDALFAGRGTGSNIGDNQTTAIVSSQSRIHATNKRLARRSNRHSHDLPGECRSRVAELLR